MPAVVAAVAGVGLVALLVVGNRSVSADSTGLSYPAAASSGAVSSGAVSSGAVSSGAPATSPSPSVTPSPSATRPPQLPRGGREVFPRYRLIGFSGGPGSAAFGRLGVGDLDERVDDIERIGRSYRSDGRQVLPVLELVTVVAHRSPGRDGKYRSRIDEDVIDRHLAAARRHRALLLLNIQPGRARFLNEVKGLERWLREPDVGLALDPEWAVAAPRVPGRSFGSVTGAELDAVSAYVAALVARYDLPQKVVVVHQLSPSIVRGERALAGREGVAMVKSVDGIGPPGAKIATWTRLTTSMSPVFHPGFKLFFDEDTEGASRLMRAREVMALSPRPEYVLYE
jgi:hypothetical protein